MYDPRFDDVDDADSVQGAAFAGVLKAGLVVLGIWLLIRLVL